MVVAMLGSRINCAFTPQSLIKLCNGLLTPTSGELLIDGKKPSRATKAIVSYLPDRDTLPGWNGCWKCIRP